MVKAIETPDEGSFEQYSKSADDKGGQKERDPIVYAEVVQAHPGRERPQHVLSAVCEIDDIQKAENYSQP